ncbi:MAG: Fpg/Nei family DNA glycosylase [Verrucomicrobia bacterium TMED71]|uniref:DNA-formamidopyrimidine glycosylase family protein n=1 Tax=Candidatus Pelagisphaera phototrophica TaxID=2684113 RepID=UPI000B73C536|nr:DNA-formamidopyrimidine glycosylase family protein [Candidatus Pelagisphaera phototrophica]QXD33293.1 Fpg/Nei family DNA glycosylase [Candidatus Pelagisphaera phototrophica]RPF74347.1 MAG: Fpg/Nei family DNA glycosylase [Verrucomicrobia bacterium TMED71]
MPEFAEVAFFCRQWDPGKRRLVQSVQLNEKVRCFRDVDPARLARKLKGNRLIGSRTHGKRMLFQLERETWLGVHLGMTGNLRIRSHDQFLEKHDHLALKTYIGWLVFNDQRQFGKIELFESSGLPKFWDELPLEVGSPKYDYDYFNSIIEKRKRGPLKSLLLMQEFFPGVGNWMADEILWKARVRPDRAAVSLSGPEKKSLFRAVKFVWDGALKYVAPDYSDPPKTWLFQHRWKAGGICPKTGEALSRRTIGGRTTCWSAKWQS